MAEAAKLKASVYRATCDSGGGEGDAAAMIEINETLLEHPHLITEAVKHIKARVKDKDPVVGVIALDLLDQCMQAHGFQFQLHVQKKVLPRVLKFATPMKGNPPPIQAKCAVLIRAWASSYGQDGRLKEYADSAAQLARSEEKVRLQQLQIRQRQAALGQFGEQASGRARPNHMSPSLRAQQPSDDIAMSAAMQASQAQAMPVVDLAQIKENLELMTSMMDADGANIRHNEVLGEVAVLCKGCQVAILNQIGDIHDEDRLGEFLAMNDQLADTLALYERKLKGGGGGGGGGPQLAESTQTLTDGTAIASPPPAYLSSPESLPMSPPMHSAPAPPGYDEDAELRKALAESEAMAKEETVKASKMQDIAALEDLFGSPASVSAAPEALPHLSPAAELKQRNQASLLDSIAGLDLGFSAQAAAPAAAAATVTAAAAPPPPPGAPPPFVPEADPFLSLSATGTPSAPPVPPSSSRPTPSVAGTTPGASDAQMAQWMARLAVNKEGVLYEDKLVQIGLKTALTATGGQLSLFVGNKTDVQLSNFSLSVGFPPQIAGSTSACATTIDPKQQLQLAVTIEIKGHFAHPLPLALSFDAGADARRLSLFLPVYPHKFAAPLPLDPGAFKSKWAALLFTEPGVGVPVTTLQDKYSTAAAVRTLLGGGVRMAVQDAAEPALAAAAASVTTPEGTATVLVQLQVDDATKSGVLLVRSDNASIRDGYESVLLAVLLRRE